MITLYILITIVVILILIIFAPSMLWQHGTIDSPRKRARKSRLTGKVQFRYEIDSDWIDIGWEEWHNFEPYK